MEDQNLTARERLLRSTQDMDVVREKPRSQDDYHDLSDEEARERFRAAAAKAVEKNPQNEQKATTLSKLANFFFGGTRK